jgi:hypothetical protein
LVLYHLNAEALRNKSPYIEMEDSLTVFVKRTLGLDGGGRTIRTVKEQLNRLAALRQKGAEIQLPGERPGALAGVSPFDERLGPIGVSAGIKRPHFCRF